MLYEVIIRYLFSGQQMLNRFHYNSGGTPASVQGSFGLVSALGAVPELPFTTFEPGTFMGNLQVLQSTNVQYTEIQVAALYDPLDFYVLPFPGAAQGSAGTESLPIFNAWGFFSSRVRTDIKRGFKRIPGITESAVGSEGMLVAGAITIAEAFAASMSEVLLYDDEGNTLTYSPVVLSFDDYVTPKGNTAYRKYPTLAEQLTHMAQGIVYAPYDDVRSQVSRQRGRGS